MKILVALTLFIFMSVIIADASELKRDLLPPCLDEGCSDVAVKVVLEEMAEANDIKIRIGSLVVGIPANVTKIDIAKSSALTVFRYETDPHINISAETEETFQLIKLTSNPISLSEAMEIIFTKTLKDRDVTSKYDKELLNNLMWIKKGFMKGGKEAYVYEKGRVKIYYLPNGGPPYRNLAWAIDSEHPNFALRVESDLSVTDFAQIIYSITSIKTKEK